MKKIIISAAVIFGSFVFVTAQNSVPAGTKEVKACCSKGNAEKSCSSKGNAEKACCTKGSSTGTKTSSNSEVKACSGHGHVSVTKEVQPAVLPSDKKDEQKDNQ